MLLAHVKAVRQATVIDEGELYIREGFGLVEPLIVYRPGIFYVWRPRAVEQIVLESQRGTESITNLVQRGITPVFVPDSDRDHNPTQETDEEQLEFDAGGEG